MKPKLAYFAAIAAAFALGLSVGSFLARRSASPARGQSSPPATTRSAAAAPATPSGADNFLADLRSALKAANHHRREENVLTLANSIEVSDIPLALRLVQRQSEPEIPAMVQRLLKRWARVKPEAAIAYAQSLPASLHPRECIKSVLVEWTAAAPAAAFQWVTLLPEGRQKDQFLFTVVDGVAQQNAKEAMAMLDTLGSIPTRLALQRDIVMRWSETDPEAAAMAASRIAGLDWQTLAELGGRWAAVNPTAAIAWAQSGSLSIQAHDAAVKAVVRVWAGNDSESAAAFAVNQPPGRLRDSLLDIVVKDWGRRDIDGLITWAKALPDGVLPSGLAEGISEQWAAADPKTASSFDFPSGLNHRKLLAIIADHWFKSDPAAATAWVQSLPSSQTRSAADPIFSQLLRSNPRSAADFALSLSNNIGVQTSLLYDLGSKWAQKNLSDTVAWLTQLPDGKAKAAAIAGASKIWVQTDLNSAVKFATTTPEKELVSQVAGALGASDPKRAVKWLGTLPSGDARNQARGRLVSSWAEHSPAAAAAYVATVPAEAQQEATFSLLATWGRSDPKAAAEWLTQSQHDNISDFYMGVLVSAWAQNDPAAAGAWLDSIGADQQARRDLFNFWSNRDEASAQAWYRRDSSVTNAP